MVQEQECSCGSGEYKRAVFDARNIFVTYVCDKCEDSKLAPYREEIFNNPSYHTDEPIEPDE